MNHRRHGHLRRITRAFFGCLAFVAFLAVAGTIGSMELDQISLTAGTQRGIGWTAALIFCLWRAGAFERSG